MFPDGLMLDGDRCLFLLLDSQSLRHRSHDVIDLWGRGIYFLSKVVVLTIIFRICHWAFILSGRSYLKN